jgi:hypothetical protein
MAGSCTPWSIISRASGRSNCESACAANAGSGKPAPEGVESGFSGRGGMVKTNGNDLIFPESRELGIFRAIFPKKFAKNAFTDKYFWEIFPRIVYDS